MLKDDIRICDVCGEDIPKCDIYRVATITPEVADVFLNLRDKDLVPTWTQNYDGTVSLDICLDCHLSMGDQIESIEINLI